MKRFLLTLYVAASTLVGSAAAQTQPAADRTLGEITSVNQDQRTVVLKEDKGSLVSVSIGEKTNLLRVPPGETDLKKAARITFGDMGVGDRLLAVGQKSEAKIEARTIVVMNKADLAQKQQREQQEWQKRGISGIVAGSEPSLRTFTATVGEKKYKVVSSDRTEYRRYAADSAKYSDSRESTFAELKPGDQVRVLGNKDETALTLTAERVVFGTFTRVAGVINSVNPETGEIKLTDLISRKPVTIQVTSRSNTRRLPEGIATQLAQRLRGGRGGAAPESAVRAGGPQAAAGQGTDLSQFLDRLPTLSLADLKPGSAIILTGSPQAGTTLITAITIVSGIEPIVTAGAASVQDLIGGWNLGGGDSAEPQ
jgi:hypothetical protein